MILLVDNLVNNYLNILSCLIILCIFNLTKEKYFLILLLDIILNQLPVVSILIIIIFLINKFIYKRLISNKLTKFILSIFYYFIFISLLYCINDYNFSYSYYLSSLIYSHFYNIVIFFIYNFS